MPRDHSLLRRACADRDFASHARYHRLATVAVAFPCDGHLSRVAPAGTYTRHGNVRHSIAPEAVNRILQRRRTASATGRELAGLLDSLPLAKQARTKSARPASGITRSHQRTWYNHQMRLSMKVFCLALLTVALLAGSATSLAHQSTSVGKGTKRCVPEPGADCRGVVERWTVEYHGDLRKAKFTGAVLHGADFRGADLRGTDFRGAKLRHADLRGANLKGARFDTVKQTGKNTKQGTPACAATTAGCQGANLNFANLTGAILINANLTSAELAGANLTNANLTNANFSYTLLEDTIFSGANLTNANLTNAMFKRTSPNFTNAIMVGADLSNLYLPHANLTNANLTNANLSNANLSESNLTNANLTNANLTGASFGGSTGCSTVTPKGTLNVTPWPCAN